MSDPTGLLTTYTEIADVLEALPLLCREKRRREGLSIRAAAAKWPDSRMSDRPRLSGWCSPTDQYHDGCRSAACECPAHADQKGD